MKASHTKELSWPAAATIITAMIGAVAGSIALALAPGGSTIPASTNGLATAREIGEVKARLESLETSSQQMRKELRDDIKDLRTLIQQIVQYDAR